MHAFSGSLRTDSTILKARANRSDKLPLQSLKVLNRTLHIFLLSLISEKLGAGE